MQMEMEAIESVRLVIDGETDEYLTKTTPPFNFSWVPDVVKSYAISAMITDNAGNVNATPENLLR